MRGVTTPRGSLERGHLRYRYLRRHPGSPRALRAHRQHYRPHLSGRQSSKTCLKEKGRVELSNRGSAGNPCKVGPFTRNRAGPLREIVQLITTGTTNVPRSRMSGIDSARAAPHARRSINAKALPVRRIHVPANAYCNCESTSRRLSAAAPRWECREHRSRSEQARRP